MNYNEMVNLYHALIAENNPANKELISYYDKMLPIWLDAIYAKAMKKAFIS